MKQDWIAITALVFLVAVWGSSFGLTRVALDGFPPMEVTFGRTALAAIIVSIVAITSGQGLPNTFREWKWLSMLGVFGLAAPVSALSWAQQSVDSGVAAIFISSVPLFLLLLARVVLKENISNRKWLGFTIGFLGLIWLAGPSALGDIGAKGQGLAQLACIIASIGYASGAIIIKIMPSIPPFRATAGAMISGALFLIPFGYSVIPNTLNVSNIQLLALIALGIFPSGLGQLIRYFTVKRKGPVFVSIVGFLLPVWAGFVGFFLLDESIGLHSISAYAIILGGLLISRDKA
ncbi:MAG: EamA family transporter [Paracoccaceae bacterium]